MPDDDQHSRHADRAPAPTLGAKKTVFMAGDHPVVNAGMAGLINGTSDLTLCGMSRAATLALSHLGGLHPDLLILDLNPSDQGALHRLGEIKRQLPKQRILILSVREEELEVSRALSLGAEGYIMKHQDTESLLHAIRAVLRGDTVPAPGGHARAAGSHSGESATLDRLYQLTDREREIFQLTGHGKTPPEIAQALGLSIKTIATHRTNIKDKLGLSSVTELVQRALQMQRFESEALPASVSQSVQAQLNQRTNSAPG